MRMDGEGFGVALRGRGDPGCPPLLSLWRVWKNLSSPLTCLCTAPRPTRLSLVTSFPLSWVEFLSQMRQESGSLPVLQPHWPSSPLVSELGAGPSLCLGCTPYRAPVTLKIPTPASACSSNPASGEAVRAWRLSQPLCHVLTCMLPLPPVSRFLTVNLVWWRLSSVKVDGVCFAHPQCTWHIPGRRWELMSAALTIWASLVAQR